MGEEQRDEASQEGNPSSLLSQRGPPRSWTDRLQETEVRPPQQQNQSRQPWGIQIQRHVTHETHPDTELRLRGLTSDTSPRNIHGQSQMMPACLDPPERHNNSAKFPSDGFQSGPWTNPPPEPAEQRWFRPPKIWTPPVAGRLQRQLLRPWVRAEEREPLGSVRPLLKRTVAQMEDEHEEDVRPPMKVVRHITTEVSVCLSAETHFIVFKF